MLHIYYGDGKGKTSAAVGSAVRASGANLTVLFIQLFKPDKSSERSALSKLDSVTLYPCPDKLKFTFEMSRQELEHEKQRYAGILSDIKLKAAEFDMIIIDEFFTLNDCGFFSANYLYSYISSIYNDNEIILTGHEVEKRFISLADYATHFQKVNHPYDTGAKPRRGIEF